MIKKIDINTIKEIISENNKPDSTITYAVGKNTIEILVKSSLSASDKSHFLQDVCDGCFNGDKYTPQFYDELFKIAVLEYFTNIEVDTELNTILDFIHNTNIYYNISEKIPSDVIADLSTTVNKLIEWKKQEILSSQKAELELALDEINRCIEIFDNIAKSFDGIDQKDE